MLSKILLISLAAFTVGFFLVKRAGQISSEEAHRLVEGGAKLVDVRTREEFSAGHVPKAENIPVQELDGRMAELGPKDKPIVLYCRSGARSSRAAAMLRQAGFTAVHDLGGMSRW